MRPVHHLKTWPEFFAAIKDGRKNFEVRSTEDRDFQEGDAVWLREWVPETQEYTGDTLMFRIGYVLPVMDKLAAFSLLPLGPVPQVKQ